MEILGPLWLRQRNESVWVRIVGASWPNWVKPTVYLSSRALQCSIPVQSAGGWGCADTGRLTHPRRGKRRFTLVLPPHYQGVAYHRLR